MEMLRPDNIQILRYLNYIILLKQLTKMQGGFGFPDQESTYRHDTSKKKQEVIELLKHQQKLWEEGHTEKSLLELRKAINTMKFIVRNQAIEEIRDAYEEKLRDLRQRYKERTALVEPQTNKNYGNTNNQKHVPNQPHQKPQHGGNNQELTGLKGQLADAIVSQKPNVRWEDVSGLQNAKNSLKEAVVMPIRFPEVFTGSRKPWKGILLYGPPGTGKTFLAKACATEAEGTFFSVSSSDLMSKYVGESQKLIKSLFSLAREKKPSIIFIDEVDSMCGNRSDGENQSSRRVKTQFLVQMQGVGHDDRGVLVLGATNLPWALDPAIRRRFERRIYIPLPEYEARLGMLKRNMKDNEHVLTEEDFVSLAKRTEKFSGSDISILVRDAVYSPIRRLQSATKFKKVGEKWSPCRQGEDGEPNNWMNIPKELVHFGAVDVKDFEDALKRTKPSVNEKQLEDYEDFTEAFGQDG